MSRPDFFFFAIASSRNIKLVFDTNLVYRVYYGSHASLSTAETEKKAVEEMKLLTVREVCDATRLSKSMVYKLLEQGLLHRVRLPGCAKVLIGEEELRRYIAAGLKAGAVPFSVN